MKKSWLSTVLCGVMWCWAAQAQDAVRADDDVHRALASLAERVGRLEAENDALKQRNADLERRVAELAPQGAGAAPAVAVAAVPPPTPSAPPRATTADEWYENLKISGYVFGDAYAVLANHDSSIDDRTGFWIRRGYLTFDAKIADGWSARLRFEANSPGDFVGSGKMNPFVKDAYLAWKRGGQELDMGLSATPTFDYVEKFWGERQIEKTPLDLYRMGSSRDFGVAYKGSASSGRVFYEAMVGNGAGEAAETNKGKKVMGALGLQPGAGWAVQLYADHEDRPGGTDRSTWQAFVGWKGSSARYGLQYAEQDRGVEDGHDQQVAVASAFGVWNLTERGSIVARYDRSFDGYADADQIPYLRIANDTRFDLAILAWEQKLQKKISLIPNLEYVTYRDTNGVKAPSDDLYGRLTLFFEF